jgi:hypothetical protein
VRVEGGGGGDTGAVRFYRPDGRLLPRVPEPETLPAEPVRDLERAHEELGLAIDPWTITPDWEGDRIDTDWALSVLRGGPALASNGGFLGLFPLKRLSSFSGTSR